MKTLHLAKLLIVLIPPVILIGFGFWVVAMNLTNYMNDVSHISDSKTNCNGVPCYCSNVRCIMQDELTMYYVQNFGWGIVFLSAGVIIIVISRKWWK